MDFKVLKDKKNKYSILIISLIMIGIFIVTYFITYNNNVSKQKNANFVNKNNYETSLKKNNTKDLIVVSKDLDGEFFEKNRIKVELNDLNNMFTQIYPIDSAYKIIDFNDKSITIMEDSKYEFEPNMYYIGEKNGYITVFKSDLDGKLFIENENEDISSKKVDMLPVQDREMVENYELKFDERDVVEDILSELET